MIRLPAFLLALLAALLPAAARADGWSPLGFHLGASSNHEIGGFPSYDTSVVGLRIGLFGTANVRMRGLSVSPLANGFWAKEGGDADAAGIQAGGIFNDAGTAHYGVMQLAGAVNILRGSGSFLQAAGLFNGVYGEGTGAQVAGFGNKVFKTFKGVQIAGVFNAIHDESDFFGLQVAPVNYAGGEMNGVQLGAVNYAADATGLQLGAINVADRMTGIQLGAINVAEHSDGGQIGVWNVAYTGMEGVQIGVINSVGALPKTGGQRGFSGIQIGLINEVRGEFSGIQLGALNDWDKASPATLPLLRIYF